jgi:hypothetical protein
VLFGVTIAAALGGAAYLVMRNREAARGAEFGTMRDLRASLAAADGQAGAPGGGGNQPLKLGAIIQSHPSDQMIYDLRPNLSVTFQRAPVTTNSCGMRERELPLKKDANTYRIAVIGDSFTFGWGVKEEEAFPRQLERMLNQIIARNAPQAHRDVSRRKREIASVEVLNFGVPGYSPFQEVATFEEKALLYDPDAVILFFIENDFGMPFFIRDLEQPQNLQAVANIARLAQAALSDGDDSTEPPPAPKLPKEFDPNHALARLVASASAHGTQVFLAINPKKNWRPIHKRLWVLKDTHEIRFMNFYDDFERIITTRGYTKESLTLKGDQHPSPRKHTMLAEVMAPYFLEEIS